MNRTVFRYAAAIVSLLLFGGGVSVYGQMYPERRHIRAGVRDYEKQQFQESERHSREALEKNPLSWEAAFNLGDALFRQERYDEAATIFSELTANPVQTKEQLAKSYYNLGNSQFAQYDPANHKDGKKILREAEQSYMKSLMANPNDMEAKYNLAYVQKLLEEENQQDQDDRNDQNDQNDKQEQQNENNDGDDNDDKSDDSGKDDRDDEQNGEEDSKDGGEDDREQQGDQPSKSNISREDAEAMLNAIQGQEDETREKMNEQKGVAVGTSGKNW